MKWGKRARYAIVGDICAIVNPAAASGAHTRDNLEGRGLTLAFAIVKVGKIGATGDEPHRFVVIVNICIEMDALALGFHLVEGQGEAVVGDENRRLSSGLIINAQSIDRKKTPFLMECQKSFPQLQGGLPD